MQAAINSTVLENTESEITEDELFFQCNRFHSVDGDRSSTGPMVNKRDLSFNF